MKTFQFLITGFLLLGCGRKENLSQEERLLRDITYPTEKNLKTEYHLQKLFGKGASRMGRQDKLEMLSESFYYIGSVDLDGARRLLITAMQEILAKVNENQEIRPFLSEHPLGPQNLSFGVHVHSKEEIDFHDDTRVPVNEICDVFAVKGKLTYYIRLYRTYPNDPDEKLILEETYEEALQKLQSPESN